MLPTKVLDIDCRRTLALCGGLFVGAVRSRRLRFEQVAFAGQQQTATFGVVDGLVEKAAIEVTFEPVGADSRGANRAVRRGGLKESSSTPLDNASTLHSLTSERPDLDRARTTPTRPSRLSCGAGRCVRVPLRAGDRTATTAIVTDAARARVQRRPGGTVLRGSNEERP